MKEHTPFDFRPALAAILMLAVLAAAYEAAVRLSHPAATRQPAAPAARVPADTVAPLASEEAAPAPTASPPPPAAEPPPCPVRPLRFMPLTLSDWRTVGMHHYVGTVGGQPATVLLEWPTLLNGISGTFYLHRGGPTYTLRLGEGKLWEGHLAAPPVLQVGDPVGAGGRSEWRLSSWPGAVLRGTWHDTTGNRPFVLRESYAGAVRADVQMLKLEGGHPYQSPYGDRACRWGSYNYTYLQFQAPWAVAPALRRTLGPPSAIMRRRLRAIYNDTYNEERLLTEFLLNDFHLLSYLVERSSTFAGDEHGDSWAEYYLFDLATGRKLTIASQLRPGYERRLSRLIQYHLLHDEQFNFINKDHRATWNWRDSTGQATNLVTPPDRVSDEQQGDPSDLFLTGSGLETSYPGAALFDTSNNDDYLGLGKNYYPIAISYRELRPLVRPGTPLARMLRARGLW